MCGICGIFNFSGKYEITDSLITKMRDTMIHRGPDGFGNWISEDKKVGFGHRRLSIIDLSESAGQPMSNEDDAVWIVFNGEIYNHSEIRAELEKAGHFFKTDHSDTEVILHSYEEWELDCVHRFRGMFAFAIFDRNKKRLLLVRDRIGIKPLYYTKVNGSFIFASEIKSLLSLPEVKREVNEEAFYHYLSFLTTPAPSTLFKNIYKLPAGHMFLVDEHGSCEMKEYWDVFTNVSPTNESEEIIAGNILDSLRESIKYRMVSDVPFGVFLSGGIDSSTNVALMTELMDRPVDSFSIGFKDQEKYNEFQYARQVAKEFKTNHKEILIDVNDLIEFLPKLVYYQDEPIADPVCVPLYYLAKLAKDNGVTVCQVGEGSDELFCGYPYWGSVLRLSGLNSLPFPNIFRQTGLLLLSILGKEETSYYELLRRASNKEPIFWGGAEAFVEWQKKKLLSPGLKDKFHNYSSAEVILSYQKQFKERSDGLSHLNWMSYLDLKLRLPELLLMRVDKMTMATSLEGRVPFLDHKFVETAMSIPESIKFKNGELKYILKKAVKSVIPDEIIYREKQGFGVPVMEWFFAELGELSRKKLISFCKRTNYFNSEEVESLINKKDSSQVWYLLNFVLWHEKWIEGIDA
ncbi:MAG: asparagine synthase (glutamine-hydrolyzing) [Actinobacteria bacterium]|nr:asparagine synthase (glutamine-hydrolyzing) [Actinomycetota bacterium]